jgi:hypothetical protein
VATKLEAAKFKAHWMNANAILMDAIATPSRVAFETAHGQAIRAIGASKAGVLDAEGHMQWEMAQSLARLISDVARESGFVI